MDSPLAICYGALTNAALEWEMVPKDALRTADPLVGLQILPLFSERLEV